MSGGEDGFLSRWSRLKRESAAQDRAAATDAAPAAGAAANVPESAPAPDGAAGPQAGRSLEELIDSLPRVEDLVPGQDLSVFMQAWVPADLRHAALRRMWLVDPAIRDYVSPALDYAYDYNNPSSIAGFGSMQTTADQIREVMAMFDRAIGSDRTDGGAEHSTKVEDGATPGDDTRAAACAPDVAPQERALVDTRAAEGPVAAPAPGARGGGPPDGANEPSSRGRDGATQDKHEAPAVLAPARRRHGGALPG
jgi:hypothetical protein